MSAERANEGLVRRFYEEARNHFDDLGLLQQTGATTYADAAPTNQGK